MRKRFTNSKVLIAIGAGVFLSWFTSSASAGFVTIYDNLAETTADGVGLTQIPAQSFSTGKRSVTSLEVLTLLTGFSDLGDFTVTLTSDLFGKPDPNYIDYQLNSVLNLPGAYPAFFNDVLSADTRYWIVVGGPTSAEWAYATNTSGVGVQGQPWTGAATGPYQMQVIVSAPELSTWALMLVGFAGLGFAAYHRSPKPRLATKAG
jgi:hypothetical protein